MTELKIGETATINRLKVQCIKSDKHVEDCKNKCAFQNTDCLETICVGLYRKDNTDVHFIIADEL